MPLSRVPSSFTGTTRLASPAANTVAITTSSAERLRIDSSGNVGIGTSSPDSSNKLQVAGDIGLSWAPNEFIGMKFDSGSSYKMGLMLNDVTRECKVWSQSSDSDDKITFYTGSTPSERMRITTAGLVGIGTTSPDTLLHVRKATAAGASTTGTNQCTIENNGAVGVSLITPTANQATIRHSTALDQTSSSITFDGTGRFMAFNTVAGAERMRINNNGNVLIGTTANLGSSGRVNILSADGVATLMELRYNNAAAGERWIHAIDSNNGYFMYNHNSVGVTVTNGQTSWSAVSDERLKTDLKPIENAVDKVNQLRSVTGRYNSDEEGKSRSFLIAQDIQKVLPEAVSMSKFPNSEDETEYLTASYTDVIPLLVAAIKEQQTIIASLTSRIEALENQ